MATKLLLILEIIGLILVGKIQPFRAEEKRDLSPASSVVSTNHDSEAGANDLNSFLARTSDQMDNEAYNYRDDDVDDRRSITGEEVEDGDDGPGQSTRGKDEFPEDDAWIKHEREDEADAVADDGDEEKRSGLKYVGIGKRGSGLKYVGIGKRGSGLKYVGIGKRGSGLKYVGIGKREEDDNGVVETRASGLKYIGIGKRSGLKYIGIGKRSGLKYIGIGKRGLGLKHIGIGKRASGLKYIGIGKKAKSGLKYIGIGRRTDSRTNSRSGLKYIGIGKRACEECSIEESIENGGTLENQD